MGDGLAILTDENIKALKQAAYEVRDAPRPAWPGYPSMRWSPQAIREIFGS